MIRILFLGLLAFAAWTGLQKYQSRQAALADKTEINLLQPSPAASQRTVDLTKKYQCDGRIHCSQMHSCEEATFFLKNCPGTKMDGDNDGIACEKQWC